MSSRVKAYPKPGPIGGTVIREVIRFIRSQGVVLPLKAPILIATSGGCDSVALAHLLVHFGRRVVDRAQISLLHVNHGWRGEESDADETFVQDLGKKWKIPVYTDRLEPPKPNSGSSLEDEARQARKKIYAQLAKKYSAVVLTAHQADDLAETLLWRLFTGAAQTHGGGVAFSHGVEYRPFLTIRKSRIKEYLREVGQSYREDRTNFSERFLRARMRSRLIPEVENLFPRAIQHLGALALQAQAAVQISKGDLQSPSKGWEGPEILIQAAGLRLRRPHLEQIFEKWVEKPPGYGEIHLPGGWKLIREQKKEMRNQISKKACSEKTSRSFRERWILEKS